MSQDPKPGSKDESIEIPVAELRWSLASFAAFVAAGAFLVAYFLSGQKLVFLILAVLLLIFRTYAAWRLRGYESLRAPDPKRQTDSLFTRLIVLALMYPFLLLLCVIIGAVVALARGTDVLSAMARGTLIAALLTLSIGLLMWVRRLFNMIFGPKTSGAAGSR